MSEQRNLLLAMVLVLIVLLVFDYLSPNPTPTAPQSADDGAAEQMTGDVTSPQSQAQTQGVPGATGQALLDRAAALEADPRVRIDTPRLSGSLSLRGGVIDDLTLRDYYNAAGRQGGNVTLLHPRRTENAYFAVFGWSGTRDSNQALPDDSTPWRTDDSVLSPASPVTLTWDNGAGLVFERRIEVDRDFMFTVTQTVRNSGELPVRVAPYALISRRGTPETQGFFILHEGALGVFDSRLEEVDYDDLREDGVIARDSVGGWLGITDKYWLAAIVPEQDVPFDGSFRYASSNGTPRYQADYLETAKIVPAGESQSVTVRLFAGAKEVDVIERYESAFGITLFNRAVDWGWFLFLTKPIFYALDWLNGLAGNFGVAILLLTVLVKAIFFPLANKQYVSMSRMKLVQPKVKRLQQRYKDDKTRLQQEMMELYKKEKINPLSGCLPILIQIPVFFALYKVLFVTIEMRHQPGLFWIDDLSAPDPYLLTNLFGLLPFDPPSFLAIGLWPIIMAVAMYLQMRLNPSAGDPIQQRVLMLMPFIFMFVLARFPAGLVIYWTWNTILSGLQQWVIMRRQGVPVTES